MAKDNRGEAIFVALLMVALMVALFLPFFGGN